MGWWHNLGGKIKRVLKPHMPNSQPCRVSPFPACTAGNQRGNSSPFIGALARNETTALLVNAVVLVCDEVADI